MSGNDCTPEQLAAAKHFLLEFATAAKRLPGDNQVTSADDLVRLLAWYGAIRYKAAKDGLGTLEKPAMVAMIAPTKRLGITYLTTLEG